ncbi:MAG: carbohydrate porin [Elainella sp. Prado103]|nr:carbohydrate porin [Elainella sp. Prado103]
MTISPWMMICLGLNIIAISTPVVAQPVLPSTSPTGSTPADPPPADVIARTTPDRSEVDLVDLEVNPEVDRTAATETATETAAETITPVRPGGATRQEYPDRHPEQRTMLAGSMGVAADQPVAQGGQPVAQGLPTDSVSISENCLADCNPTEQFNFNPPQNLAIPPRSVYQRPDVAQSPVIPVPGTPPLADRTAPTPPPPAQPSFAQSSPSTPPPYQPVAPLDVPESADVAQTAQPDRADGTRENLTETSDASASRAITPPSLQFQGVYLYQGGEDSARMRVTGVYPILPELQVGASIDFTAGDVFSESGDDGLSINELYVAASVPDYPNLRLVVGQVDLTSYFDRNSFAKDSATHFFNPVFATNPALSAAGLGSRQAAVLNWTIIDEIEVKASVFSSDRSISEFQVNGFAGEIGARLGNLIVRGTYITAEDAGADTGFEEIFQIQRSNGEFGLRDGDQERGYGINAEYFIPEINLGLFARYGWYENDGVDRTATTYSFGMNLLDLFMENDRLGVGYGRLLSNGDLRDGDQPDVLEAFYDFQVLDSLRLGFTFQGLDEFSETIAGFRIRADLDLVPRRQP